MKYLTLTVLILAGSVLAADTDSPKSSAALQAKAKYDMALSESQATRDQAVKRARTTYLVEMGGALDAALTAKDLAEANRIDAAIKSFRASDDAEKPPSIIAPPSRERVLPRVLDMVDLNADAGSGIWRGGSGSIRCIKGTVGCAMMTLPVALDGDYEVTLVFRRLNGVENVGTVLPVGDTTVLLSIDGVPALGIQSGFEAIDGKPLYQNPTSKRGQRLENGKTYVLQVTVKSDRGNTELVATLDGQLLTRWKGSSKSLSMRKPWIASNPKCIAVGAWECEVEWLAATIKVLTGNATPLRK